mmetsp:Transcript_14008/g.34228  ORF Transcript_14008/g.34228 Transcript_14008/m.34228 type:complete len:293 (+) Transcript_14008:749-1627(+)
MNERARRGAADLTVGPEDTKHEPLNGLVHVNVVEDDDGGLPAELERNVAHTISSRLHDLLARLHRPRESNLVHPLVCTQRCSSVNSQPRHHVQAASRQSRLVRDHGDVEARVGSQLRRLEHHTAPGAERSSDLPGGHQSRVVPRGDAPRHAYRVVEELHIELLHPSIHLAALLTVEGLGKFGVVTEAPRHIVDIPCRLKEGLARVDSLLLRKSILVRLHAIGDLAQDLGAVLSRGLSPSLPRLARRRHGLVDVLGGASGGLAQHGLVVGVDDVQVLSLDGGLELPVDEVLVD